MNKLLTRVFAKARIEGRLCECCRWIVTKKDFERGHKLCAGCRSALTGVHTSPLYSGFLDEPIDKTGEMP